MTDNGTLVGRIVGFGVPYMLDPSQVEPGESLESERTVWGRVVQAVHDLPGLYEVAPIHTPVDPAGRYIMQRSRMHTVMPASYYHV